MRWFPLYIPNVNSSLLLILPRIPLPSHRPAFVFDSPASISYCINFCAFHLVLLISAFSSSFYEFSPYCFSDLSWTLAYFLFFFSSSKATQLPLTHLALSHTRVTHTCVEHKSVARRTSITVQFCFQFP